MEYNQETVRILVVEADPEFAEATQRLLAEVGQVTWVPDADGALQLLLTGDWNILVVDWMLPEMNGVDLLRAIRSRDPAPIAIVRGDESFDHAVAAIRAGASDYIAKSLPSEVLLERVREAANLDRATRLRRSPGERVLAIGAHPDDVELGCGGILLRHRDAGHSLTILTLTDGEAGGSPAIRRAEARRAAALLSARLLMLGLVDTEVSEGGTTISEISKVIEEIRPTTIYTHTDSDHHQDHRNAYRATMVAARSVPRIYAYQSPSSTVEFRPSLFVSIDDLLERKLELIEPHESQAQIRKYLERDVLCSTARYWGRFSSSDYAEPLEVLRQADIVGTTSTPFPAEARVRGGVLRYATA
jgi:LmbE family N-acetylglucosaminyl deacetylase/CheY-like chemotaxis protein